MLLHLCRSTLRSPCTFILHIETRIFGVNAAVCVASLAVYRWTMMLNSKVRCIPWLSSDCVRGYFDKASSIECTFSNRSRIARSILVTLHFNKWQTSTWATEQRLMQSGIRQFRHFTSSSVLLVCFTIIWLRIFSKRFGVVVEWDKTTPGWIGYE